jgi:hypothetical protein
LKLCDIPGPDIELGEAMVQIVADRRATSDTEYMSAWGDICAEISGAGCLYYRGRGLGMSWNQGSCLQ